MLKDEISFFELAKVVIIFVAGFLAIVTSVVFIQKRSLEIIIEANNTTSDVGKKAKLNIKSLNTNNETLT